MRYRKLTAEELAELGHAIQSASPRVTVRQLACNTGYSHSTVVKARYLINCQPVIWQSCIAGLTSIDAGYKGGYLSPSASRSYDL